MYILKSDQNFCNGRYYNKIISEAIANLNQRESNLRMILSSWNVFFDTILKNSIIRVKKITFYFEIVTWNFKFVSLMKKDRNS